MTGDAPLQHVRRAVLARNIAVKGGKNLQGGASLSPPYRTGRLLLGLICEGADQLSTEAMFEVLYHLLRHVPTGIGTQCRLSQRRWPAVHNYAYCD
jgi:hypothetical protein